MQPEGLLERDDELARLSTDLATARAGRGRAVLVSGAAGIGKTALLSCAERRAQMHGMPVLRARGTELERDFAFGVARQLFERMLRGLDVDERARLLDGAAQAAGALLDAPAGPESESEHRAFAVVHGLYTFVANLAERRPLVILVDDAHWADTASLRWLSYLAGRLDAMSALVLVAVRAADPAGVDASLAAIAAEPGTHVMTLQPLGAAASEVLLRRHFGSPADPEFSAACHRATAGNPFFLDELCRSLHAARVAPTAESAAQVVDQGPAAVARSVLQRTAGLSAPSVRLARALALLDGEAELRHAAALAGLDDATAADAATRLANAQIVADDGRLSFQHPIVRSAIYADIPGAERAHAHARAARMLAGSASAERISAHVLFAMPAQDPWVITVLERAAADALGRGAPDSAVTYLRRALAEPPGPGDRQRLLAQLGWAEYLAHDRDAAVAHLVEASRTSSATVDTATLALRTSRVLVIAGVDRSTDAVEILDRAIVQIPAAQSEVRMRLEAELVVAAGLKLSTRSLHRKWLETLHARSFGDDHAERALLATLVGWTVIEGRVPGRFADLARRAGVAGPPEHIAGILTERALANGRLLEDEGPESDQFYTAVSTLYLIGRLERSAHWLDRAIQASQSRGSLVGFALASAFRAEVCYRMGELSQAEAHARAAMAFAPGDVTAVLVNTLLERGDLPAAAAVLDRRPVDIGHDHLLMQPVIAARGRLRILQGETRHGATDLAAVGQWLDRWPVLNPAVVPWRSMLAPCLARQGDTEQARALAAEELKHAAKLGQAPALGIALRGVALLEGQSDSIPLLRDAARVLESSEAPLEHAWALMHLGAALRRAGHRREARDPLRHALDMAHRCSADRLAERARTELLATGARPRRRVIHGRDALTPTERRIAELAATGQTTREIADGLFVTCKTIETHLGHVYRKLDIHSRTQLTAALGPRE